MKTLIFGGSGDDTFGEITPRGDDYDSLAIGDPIEWLISSDETGESMLVVGQYCPGSASGWLIGVARADDDDGKHMPDWPIAFHRSDRTYSPGICITVPDDATIRCLQRKD